MRRITPHEISLVALVLTAAIGADGFKEQSIRIDGQDKLRFVTLKGVRGGLAGIDALEDAGFNTKSDGDLTTNENGVRGADGAIMQDCWIKIYDIDAPLFEDEDAVAKLAPKPEKKAQTDTKEKPTKDTKTDTGGGGDKDTKDKKAATT